MEDLEKHKEQVIEEIPKPVLKNQQKLKRGQSSTSSAVKSVTNFNKTTISNENEVANSAINIAKIYSQQ